MPFASKTNTDVVWPIRADFSIRISREQRLLARRELKGEKMRDGNDVEMEFAAYIGIDWADQKHACALQSSTESGVVQGELIHKPEAVESLGGRPVPTIRRTSRCHRARAIAWIASLYASQV